MNKITCITSTVHSGKTKELVSRYIKTLKKLNSNTRPTFVVCDSEIDYILNFIKYLGEPKVCENSGYSKIMSVNTKDKLDKAIIKAIESGTTKLYIDMPYTLDVTFMDTLNIILGEHPLSNPTIGINVVFTRHSF